MLCGLAPAIFSTSSDPSDAMKSGVRAGNDRHHQSFSRLLVIGEIAFALILLTGSGLLLRSFERLLQVSLGFDQQRVLTARLSFPPAISENPTPFSKAAVDRISTMPGVTHAAIATGAPFHLRRVQHDVRHSRSSSSLHRILSRTRPCCTSLPDISTLSKFLLSADVSSSGDMRATNWLDPGAVRIIDEALAKRYFPGPQSNRRANRQRRKMGDDHRSRRHSSRRRSCRRAGRNDLHSGLRRFDGHRSYGRQSTGDRVLR